MRRLYLLILSVGTPLLLTAWIASNVMGQSENIDDWRPLGYEWTMPPIAALISVSSANQSGMAMVTGNPGAVPAENYVLVKNVSTGDYAISQANASGAFAATLFAPEDSSLQIAYMEWAPVDVGAFHLEPSTQIYVDNIPASSSQNIPYTLSGLIAPFSNNGTFVANGILNNSQFQPTEQLSTTVHLRIDVTSGLVYNFNDLQIEVGLGLERMFDIDGKQHASPNRAFASTLLAPTGLPILQDISSDYGWFNSLTAITIQSGAISQSGDVLETAFVLDTLLPSDLPPGIYRPTLSFRFGVIAEATPVVTIERDSISTAHEVGATPYLPVIKVGNPAPPKLVWMLLANTLSSGTRGAIALNDRTYFDFSPMIVFQGSDFIIPKIDSETGLPIIYRLEPFLPLIAATEKYQLAFPRLPFNFPGNSLTVHVQKPTGAVDVLGPATIQQSLDSLHARTTFGVYPVFANPGPGYVYEITTFDDQFNYQFTDYGYHVITMTGTLIDIWGNEYEGGGTYEVFVARTLDLEPGTLPGTPFEVGDIYAPSVIVEPNIPAEIEINLRQYSGPNGSLVMERRIQGHANNAGYFYPTNATPITFIQPGEYLVEIRASYIDADGALWMGSAKGASVIETPGTQLIAHGRRGMTNSPESDNLQWFFAKDLPGNSANGDYLVGHINMPYQRGDIYWFVDTVNETDGMKSEVNSSEAPALSVHDTVGNIAEFIDPGGNQQGQMSLYTQAIGDYESGSFPELTNLWSYFYSVSQRPGVPIRSFLIEGGYGRGYWNSNDPYNLVIGNGVIGDLPNDFKFQYGGAVVRYLGDLNDSSDDLDEYAIYASGAIIIPSGTILSNRVGPPFQGGGGGPNFGPLMTLLGQDINIFFHPTGVQSGSVLEVGDTLAVSGAVMPPLDSTVSVTINGSSGQLTNYTENANKIGYFYHPEHDLQVNEPGRYLVTITVEHTGATSAGSQTLANNSGDILGTTGGTFDIYVVPKAQASLCIDALYDTSVAPATPLTITGYLPADMSSASVYYSARMPEVLMESGTLPVSSGQFTYVYDPIVLHADFRNLDIFDPEGNPSAVDPVTISFFAVGSDVPGQPKYLARSLILQGDQLLTDVSALPNGLVQLLAGDFRPQSITIVKDNSVIWQNCSSEAKQIDGDGWSTGSILPYRSSAIEFNIPGTYSYHDASDPAVTGTIAVVEDLKEIYLPIIHNKP